MSDFADGYLSETADITAALTARRSRRSRPGWRACATAAGAYSSSAWAAAGHATHAVNDFRKLCGLEAYTPTDNVSEFTARTNDEGWDTTFSAWLEASRLGSLDALLVFSVGGGSPSRACRQTSGCRRARPRGGAAVFGIVGRNGGHTARWPPLRRHPAAGRRADHSA